MSIPLVPRPAATLILLRDSAAGPEVLLLQRTKSAVFLGGAYVFPGGSLDPEDTKLSNRVIGLELEGNTLQPPIEYWIAAVRECFEEAGVLLACDLERRPVPAERAERLMAWRSRSFAELLEKEDLYIPAGELAWFGHWVTAPGRARRFDTRFFVAAAPEGQQGKHDANETVRDLWITPREALERSARGEIELVFATQHTLRDLSRFDRVEDALGYVRSLGEIEVNRACWAQGKDGAKLFRRADPPYHEIHWSDPEETGQTSYDLVAGEPKRLDRWVTRIVAPNPGMMTGPGTNTYVVGTGA